MQMELDSIRIHYKPYNSPKHHTDYIVFIHGLGLDLTMWEPIIPCLQEHFHILTFDIRGHGGSGVSSSDITWDILVEDLNSLVAKLNISEFHLVGLGFGGNLAIKFLEKYPDKVKKLILTSVYMYFPEKTTLKELEKRKQLVTDGKMSELSKNMIHQICLNLTPERELLLTKAYSKVDQKTYFKMLELLTTTVTVEDLKKIDKEVLLIQGDSDPLFPIQQTNLYQTYLKYSASYVVTSSSNVVPLDNPYTFGKLVGHFIQSGISSSFTTILEQEFENNIDDWFRSFNMLEINIMNGFSVKYNGNDIIDKWNQRKAKNLLAYIAYHNPSTRDELINTFWGESDLVNAKNNLRVSLNHLKGILKKHDLNTYLIIERESISFAGDIAFDLSNYMQLLYTCYGETDVERKKVLYRELISQYKERLFIDLYDDWLMEIQTEIDSLITIIKEDLEQSSVNQI